MRLRRLQVEESGAGGALFDGADILFGREVSDDVKAALSPLCLIGPNGSGKSQFLQLIAEIFQTAWHAHAPNQERVSSNEKLAFELTYSIAPRGSSAVEEVSLVRKRKGRTKPAIELHCGEKIITASEEAFGRYLPSLIIGYTSGDNETLSLPFLASRSGYASDVASAALQKAADSGVADNRMMMIDYGTNLEVLFANMILGKPAVRKEILDHANLADLASCRCTVRLAHSVINRASARQAKKPRRKGIQLTKELEQIIERLQKIATCWHLEPETETYTFDFFISKATRSAFAHYWNSAFDLYRDLHKLALLNDLAIPRPARRRLERAVKDRRFALRLPEPQQEELVFGFEEFRFWPNGKREEPVDYVTLSDGEHQQALVLGVYAMVEDVNALFLLDEPESHFNPLWRVKFVQRLKKLTGSRGNQELLMTTHAPFVPSDMPRDHIMIFSRNEGKVTVAQPIIETFGAEYDRILENCFKVEPNISRIAEAKIESLLDSADLQTVERGLGMLGPSLGKGLVADHLRKLRSQ
ncbi:restriction system-associated AAA family ATPase [Variovorax sp. 350MFTsu5.1]|uniref:restriction system-associated AAA family ATPase n=1 Tax=Variovorax sp. 350MFTsu5.1 TaxID=3158365 RepID=UPI003AADD422